MIGPSVAVLIPCFNDGGFLAEAVASVDGSIGLPIIIDDGSTDRATLELLGTLECSGVQVLRQRNAGPGPARMAGLRATSTPFVLPLDADDRLLPGALQALLDALHDHPDASFAFGDYVTAGSTIGRWEVPQFDRWALQYGNWWPVTSLFRREAVLDAQGWGAFSYEDWGLWMGLAQRGHTGVHCGRPVYQRLLHDNRRKAADRARHRVNYRRLRVEYPQYFAQGADFRRETRPSIAKRMLYPKVLGSRLLLPTWVENAVIDRRLRRASTRHHQG